MIPLGALGAARVNIEALAKSLQMDLDRGARTSVADVVGLAQAQALVSIAESLAKLVEQPQGVTVEPTWPSAKQGGRSEGGGIGCFPPVDRQPGDAEEAGS